MKCVVLACHFDWLSQLQVTHGNPIPRGYSSVLLVGGVSMGQQVQALQQGVSVAVATPGKLLHLISIGSFQVNR